jgi:hypothetical protein
MQWLVSMLHGRVSQQSQYDSQLKSEFVKYSSLRLGSFWHLLEDLHTRIRRSDTRNYHVFTL